MKFSCVGRILLVAILAFVESAFAYYNPSTGRWLNRDLIGEQDGPGIQVFARNTPTSVVDADGLANRNAPPSRITNPGGVIYPGWSETAPWDPARMRTDHNRVPFTTALGVAGSACSVVIGGTLVLSPEPTALTKAAGAYMMGAGLDGLYSSFSGKGGLREQGLQAAGLPPGMAVTAVLVTDMAVCGKCCPGGNPIRFSQGNVGSRFRHGEFANQNIDDVVAGLRDGSVLADQLPIQVVKRGDVTYSLNNRSLLTLRLAGMEPTIIQDMSGNAKCEKILNRRFKELGEPPSVDFVPRIRGAIQP